MTWHDFLERRDLAVLVPGSASAEPKELFRAARRVVAAKDVAGALEIRSRILLGQGADGSWEADGTSNGRKIIAAVYRIRTLEYLRPLLAETLVRK